MEFQEFRKIARLSRECVITEKIDGTNACIYIGEDGEFLTGSRTRWITPQDDNYGFAKWAYANKEELLKLGKGFHYGEWWGKGIQRNYGLNEKKFSLFNVHLWSDKNIRPSCCDIVPVLSTNILNTTHIDLIINTLATAGSVAAPGFMKPEGIVIFHRAANLLFKKTIEKDEQPKGIK